MIPRSTISGAVNFGLVEDIVEMDYAVSLVVRSESEKLIICNEIARYPSRAEHSAALHCLEFETLLVPVGGTLALE